MVRCWVYPDLLRNNVTWDQNKVRAADPPEGVFLTSVSLVELNVFVSSVCWGQKLKVKWGKFSHKAQDSVPHSVESAVSFSFTGTCGGGSAGDDHQPQFTCSILCIVFASNKKKEKLMESQTWMIITIRLITTGGETGGAWTSGSVKEVGELSLLNVHDLKKKMEDKQENTMHWWEV